MSEITAQTMSEEAQLDEEERADPDRHEETRRRVWEMRARGLSYSAIAKIIGCSKTMARKHFERARLECVNDFSEGRWKIRAGHSIRRLQWAQETARGHLAALEAGELDEQGRTKPGTSKKGSLQAAIWLQTYLRACKQEDDLEIELGLFPRQSDKLDVTIRDAREMSIEELQNECARLEADLAGARIVKDKSSLLRKVEMTIDVAASAKSLEDPRQADKAVRAIERMERDE